jgi:hypothetical protein
MPRAIRAASFRLALALTFPALLLDASGTAGASVTGGASDTFPDGTPRHCKPSPTKKAAVVCGQFAEKFGVVAFRIDKKYGPADGKRHSAAFLLLSVENEALAGESLAGAGDRAGAERIFDHAMDGLIAIENIRATAPWVTARAAADIKAVGRDLDQLER